MRAQGKFQDIRIISLSFGARRLRGAGSTNCLSVEHTASSSSKLKVEPA